MQYRKFGNTGILISALGFGCMRFPTHEDNGKQVIQEEEAIQMLRCGIEEGINYIDTAYAYHDGKSEFMVGKALSDGYRDKVYLATKSPVWLIHSPEDFDRILDEQLSRLKTDHIDFYLLHALDLNRWNQTILKYDLLCKMEQAKQEGKINYIGFSFHDDDKAFLTILNGYDHWDFCQIQMNYIDVDHQATLKGIKAAAAKGLGVIIMEPLLGGKLANPPQNVKNFLSKDKTPVEWALDFLWNQEEVSLLLSGMSSMEQTTDNLMYADRSGIGMLSPDDLTMFARAKEIYESMPLVSCTKCSYCMPCPFGLDIPQTFEAYNKSIFVGMEESMRLYNSLKKKADQCKKCRKCEQVCPQGLKISEIMPNVHHLFAQEAAQK